MWNAASRVSLEHPTPILGREQTPRETLTFVRACMST